MKKLFILFLMLGVFNILTLPALAQDVTVTVNGKQIYFPDQKPYIDENNRTMVPVRFVSEALGATVGWNGTTQTVSINQDEKAIVLRIGEMKATVNGVTKTFDTKAVLKNSRTMVPLRFVSEAMGAKVEWIADTGTVKISTEVAPGYYVTSDLQVEPSSHPEDKEYAELSLLILLYKPLEPQYTDAEAILKSRVGETTTKEIMAYVKQKTDPDFELKDKYWDVNGKRILVGSGGYNVIIQIWNK